MKVRGQFCEVSSLLYPLTRLLGNELRSPGLLWKHLYLLSYLVGPWFLLKLGLQSPSL